MKKIAVLHIASTYLDRPFYKTMFSSMEQLDIRNIIYVPRWSSQNSDDQEKNIYIIDRKFSKLDKLLYLRQQRYIMKNIQDRICLKEINCIHVHRILYGGYAALYFKKQYHIPYVVAVRNSDIFGFGVNIKIWRKHACCIMLNASKVVFMSKVYMEYVLKMLPAKYRKIIEPKCIVITNGIDEYFLNNKELTEKSVLQDDILKLISIAELNRNKNVVTTIKACDLLIKQGKQLHLTLIGKCKSKYIYNKIIKKDYISYYPLLSKEEVCRYLRESDIFVMPSVRETFGLVYAEAMSQGLPVIYTKGQGFDGQYANGEVGFSVTPYNYQDIADKVLLIANNYNQISKRCLSVSGRYDWDIIAKKYRDIYDTWLLD